MFAPMRYSQGQFVDPWRLVRVAADEDPSAGEYGLLDPHLADEPDLPREGLLSEVGAPNLAADDGEALPIPARKPPLPTASVPFALRDRTLEMPRYLAKAHQDEWAPFHHSLRRTGMPTEMEIDLARTMFGYEGGMQPNSANQAVGGITQTYLDRAAEHGVLPRGTKTSALSLDDVARLYRSYFRDAMNSVSVANPVSSIPDKKAAGQMMDLIFMEDKKRRSAHPESDERPSQ